MEQGKEDLIAKYKARLEGQFAAKGEAAARKVAKESALSTNYLEFKKELLPKHLSTYERLCNVSGRLLRIKPDKKQSESLWSYINLCHLNTTPSGTFSFAILSFLAVFVSVTLVGFLLFRSMFFIVYGLAVGAVVMVGFMKLPEFFANNWRLKASNQMVQAIFYVSTYMRHT
ncbi:hypothetical protein HY640_03020, partial [Candidatus Woesearchaeota archaeon]|nr:hypothetical protein [Candidatus Woesearchaeota archaeon]